jgi:hypothetical protein
MGWVRVGEFENEVLGLYACKDQDWPHHPKYSCWWPAEQTDCPPVLKLKSLDVPSILLACPEKKE